MISLPASHFTWQCRRCKRYWFDPWVRKILLEKGMATHSSILTWRIPWTENPGGLQFIGSQRVGCSLECTSTFCNIYLLFISLMHKWLSLLNLLSLSVAYMLPQQKCPLSCEVSNYFILLFLVTLNFLICILIICVNVIVPLLIVTVTIKIDIINIIHAYVTLIGQDYWEVI